MYAMNGSGDYLVTGAHPFMTTEGWKSFEPERSEITNPGLVVGALEVGDTLVTSSGMVVLTQIDKKYSEETVYTIEVDGTHDYYADGFLVHNKIYP